MQMNSPQSLAMIAGALLFLGTSLPGCQLFNTGRILYDREDVRIGIEDDPTVPRSDQPVQNNQPADLSPQNIQALLQNIAVTGWSGTLTGLIEHPRPVPLFTLPQLLTISTPVATAFQKAGPTERVSFSLPKPDVSYSEDRTSGYLFLRGRYLHIVLTDHASFIRADTGGGETRDPRDTKGMKLWTAVPSQTATVPDAEEPKWAPFEPVHLSLNVKEVLAQTTAAPAPRREREQTGRAVIPPPAPPQAATGGVSAEDLQLQIRELTRSNLELRERLDDQHKQTQTLTNELEQLRSDLDKTRAKKPSSRKPQTP